MKIVKIRDEKFYVPTFDGYVQPKNQYCFKDERGYVGFKDSPYVPYFPQGGKKALECILNDGGFTSECDLVFIQPINL